jgi:hypothetical protein
VHQTTEPTVVDVLLVPVAGVGGDRPAAESETKREIIRCLKRYIARRAYASLPIRDSAARRRGAQSAVSSGTLSGTSSAIEKWTVDERHPRSASRRQTSLVL